MSDLDDGRGFWAIAYEKFDFIFKDWLYRVVFVNGGRLKIINVGVVHFHGVVSNQLKLNNLIGFGR